MRKRAFLLVLVMLKISLSSSMCMSSCAVTNEIQMETTCSVSSLSCCDKTSHDSERSSQSPSDCSCQCCSVQSFVTLIDDEQVSVKENISIILPEPDYHWVAISKKVFHPPC